MLRTIEDRLTGERQTLIDLQRLLVSHSAVGPESGGHGEANKAKALKQVLADWGFPAPFDMPAPDARVASGQRPNFSYVIQGVDTTRTFWVLSHLDIVSPGDLARWETDPFELVVADDLLIGRGVEDNHHGIVSSVLLAKAILQENGIPPLNLGLLFIADEECGNKYGLDYVMRTQPNLFKKGDLFLVPDAGLPQGEMIEVAEKSMLWLKVIVDGKQCHASMPDDGCNTLRAASDFIVRLKRLEAQFDAVDPLFTPARSTFEPTKKEANVESINILPGRDVFYMDCRVLPIYQLCDVMDAIKKIGDEITADYGVRLAYEPVQSIQAAPATSPEAEIVKRLTPAIRAVYGSHPAPMGVGGGTLAALLRREGHEAAVWSAILGNAHQPNERARVSTMLKDAKVMARVLWGPGA